MFQAVSPPIIRSSKLYTQHLIYVKLASKLDILLVILRGIVFDSYQRFQLWDWSSHSMKLTTHIHLVQRSRMSGAVPLLLLYAIMSCTETPLPSLFSACFPSLRCRYFLSHLVFHLTGTLTHGDASTQDSKGKVTVACMSCNCMPMWILYCIIL
jgi:hypothetical protein